MSQPTNSLRVLMMPDYRADNPYQALLAEALQQQETEVYFPVGYRRVFPIFRALQDCADSTQVLHLHWISPYIKGTNWLQRSVYSIKFLLDILIVRATGVKIAWTIHNRLSHEALFPQLELWTIRQFVKLVDRIIVHHYASLSELAELYRFDVGKATVIPHGHYRTVYGKAIAPAEARAILGLPPTGKIYLSLGMLRPYKGIERFLQTWQRNPEVAANHTLLIAGKTLDDVYGQQLTKQVAGTKGAILHLGFVKDHLIPIYFSAADVVVLPFENVLTSGSLILAMSYGKPIIAPRSPGISETLGTASELLYDSQDEQGLVRAMQHSTVVDLAVLWQQVNQECDRLGWETIAEKTCLLYQFPIG
ncbi:glycosyltransferase family 4 protein [Leptolyngbya sp. FACHB-711]|uniref:glycosyltransferase family 4 protein n=1 Tax=Leptolyngbya sp. FACHB-711 TaxID=2692813 RepID=UPI00168786B4|nr:glycosyltransferase family 4 protein [Leptolyngbya sp. FACHB-711]MBD2028219.1 glycosyltransferase family 4 protein [Leptolyngbya sp. FACHB-711]